VTTSAKPPTPSPRPRLTDGVPAPLRRWWSGRPRLFLQDTGAFLLPALLPLRTGDRVLVLDDAAMAATLAEHGHLSAPPLVLQTRPGGAADGPQVSPAALPVADGAFTVIVVGHRIRAWDDETLLAFLRECWRALTHNGIVVLWEVAPSRSARVNAIWGRLLPERSPRLRRFGEVGALGREAGFAWIQTLALRPFLWPPGPRLAVLMRKEHYTPETVHLAPGETPPQASGSA
jgi:SAM-dependent methyltransferase